MFEHMIAETIKMNIEKTDSDNDGIDFDMKPVQVRSSLFDRVLAALGEAMINIGLKLKYRPHASLPAEQAQAPNFLIML